MTTTEEQPAFMLSSSPEFTVSVPPGLQVNPQKKSWSIRNYSSSTVTVSQDGELQNPDLYKVERKVSDDGEHISMTIYNKEPKQ